MKKILKITGITGIVLALVLVILLVLPFLLKDKVAEIVKSEANKMLNARLDFEELDISLLRNFPKATIALEKLSVVGIDRFEGDTLVAADEIAVTVDIMSLFRDSGYEITNILLDRPVINALVCSDSTANWDIVKPDDEVEEETDEPESESAIKLQLRKFHIKKGAIAYYDEASNMSFRIGELDIMLKGALSGLQTTLKCDASAKQVYFAMDGVPYLKNAEMEADMKLLADLENYKFILDENVFRLNAIEMTLDGWVAMPDDAIDMDISLSTPKINFKDILSMVPAIYQNNFADLQTSGNVALKAVAKGRLQGDSYPAFTVNLDVNNAKVFYTGMPKSVDDIAIGLRVDNPGGDLDGTTIDIDPFRFTFAGNPFALTLSASTPLSDLHFKATADGTINLGGVKDIYPLGDDTDLNGIIAANLKLGGKMSDIENERYQNIEGEGSFSITDMKLVMPDLPPVTLSKADAQVSPKALTLSRLDLLIGRSDLHAKGEVSNYLPYVLNNETLNGSLTLTSSLLDLNELMGESSEEETAAPESETPAAADAAGSDEFAIPENLNLALQTNIDKILFQDMMLGHFAGKVTLNKGVADLSLANIKLDMPDMPAIGVSKADLRATTDALTLSRFDLTVGRSDLHAKGQVSNYMPYLLQGKTLRGSLTLTSSLLDLNELMGESSETETAATSEAANTSTLEVFVVPTDLDLALQASVGKILFQKMTLDRFTGKVTVADGTVKIDPLSVNAFGGTIAANASYSTAQSPESPAVTFDLDIQKARFEEIFKQLDMVQQLVPLFSKTGGSCSLSLDMDCRLDAQMSPKLETLSAKGRLKSNDIRIQNIDVFDQLATILKNDKLRRIEAKDIDIAFAIDNGRITTSPFNLKLGNILLTLSGSTGLDQTIDYTAVIDLSKEKAGEYVGTVTAKIGGTFTKPDIKVDLGSAVKQAVTNKVIEAIAGKGTTDEQVANIRKQADEAGKKLVEAAEKEGQKLVDSAKNPLAKVAAEAAKKKMVEEAKKQASRLADEAEAKIREMKGE